MMLSFRLWIVLLSVITTHGAIKQYDMGEICGRTVSMNDDDIYGFETLLNMTSQLSGTGRCHLTFEKRSDYDYLHFYFSAVDLSDCNTMSLYINEGDTVQSAVAHDDIPRVCGPMAASIVNDHYSSSRRYIALEFTWNPATTFRGSVFRLVANSYTCDETCGSRKYKCDDGPCIYSELNTTSGLDFCGGSLLCTPTSDGTEDGTSSKTATFVGGIAFLVVICTCMLVYFLKRFFSNGGRRDICFDNKCCDWCGGTRDGCRRGLERCCDCTGMRLSDVRQRLTRCCGWIQGSWDEFSCPLCAETVANTNHNVSHYSDTDQEYPDDLESDNSSEADGGATADPNAPPPSYTAAMRARPRLTAPLAQPLDTPTDPDPPSYNVAVDIPAFEPPEYDMVMANPTFYGATSCQRTEYRSFRAFITNVVWCYILRFIRGH